MRILFWSFIIYMFLFYHPNYINYIMEGLSMGSIKNFLNKCLEVLLVFANLKPIVALKDGFMLTIPATLVGAIFLLLANIPINGYADFMAGIFGPNWSVPLTQVSGATFDILAILVVIGIAYKFASEEGYDGISCAILALISFLIVTATHVVSPSGEIVTGVIPKAWVGGNGIITAIVMGLLTSYIFCFFIKRNIIIKLPDSVPPNVSKAFAALIPGFVVFLLSAVIFTICSMFGNLTFTELIFKVLQAPLQMFASSLPGAILLSFLITILFWAGIHGPNLVGGILNPIWLSCAIANQAVLDAGQQLIIGENAKVFTLQVFDVFIKLGGCGSTIGLLIVALLTSKSAQMKSISRLSIVPGLFNINEPVIFGLPIVFNPYFLVPFNLVPIAGVLITYIALITGFLPPFSAVQVPWTTPPLISGLLISGFPGLVVQLLIIAASVVIYFPFVKLQDREFVKQEAAE